MKKLIGHDIKAVLFDHGDTLVGTIGPKWKQHKHVARTFYNKELQDDDIRPLWGKPLNDLVSELYQTEGVEEAVNNYNSFREEFPKDLINGTLGTLLTIHDVGKVIGVITATSRVNFEHDLELHHIPKNLLAYTQTADDTDYHKPDPRVFKPTLEWLSKKKISPAEVVYIGDSLNDMQAARGAGFAFIGVETGLTSAQQFRKAGAVSIPSIADLVYKEHIC